MKSRLKKIQTLFLCICLICNIVGMQGFGMQKAYAAADTKITGVTASASSESGGFEANYAIDNPSIESYWSASNPGVSWLQLTLDHIYYIDRWYVINVGKYFPAEYNTRDYELQGSLNGTTWTNIDSVVGNTAVTTNRPVAPFSAKYVRIYITDPDQYASSAQAFGTIVDFEVFATAPVVTSVEVPSSNNYSVGNALTFTVRYPAEVTVNTASGTPYIPVTIGTKTVNAVYKSGSGTQALTFEYIVQSGDYDNNGISLGASINSNGGTIRDAVSNNANLTLNSVGDTSGIVMDTRPRYSISIGALVDGGISASVPAPFSTLAVIAGETVNLNIDPVAGKQLKAGSLKYNDGSIDHVITGTSFTMPASNVTVMAEFEVIPPTTYTVAVGTLVGGSITASPTVAEAGDTIAMTITPDAGKQLKAGSLKYNDGTQDVEITGTSFTMPATNVTVTAEFEVIPPTTYTVAIGTLVGGSITASPTVAEAGNAIALTITPDAGKQLKAGSLKYNDGSDHVITGTTFTMPAANVTVTAEFEDIPPTTYTVTVGTLARGSITASPTVAEAGDTIALTITPDAGKQLKAGSLKYNHGTQDISITGTSFTMPAANVTVTAEFETIPPTTYTVTVGTLVGGSITASPTVAEAGDTIALTITPDAGKQLKAGSLKYNDGTQDVEITGTSFTMPATNVTVTAEFEVIPPTTYTVAIGTLVGGSITASPTVAEAGDTIALTITPEVGKQLKAGSLKYSDGTQDISITGTSFVMPAANVTVTAEFEDIPPTTYTVTVATLVGGSITASPTVAEAGNTIALTITPDAGKQLKAGSLKYNDGTQDIAITGTSFVMPAANVTVMAEFEDIPPTTYTVTVGTLAGGSITTSPTVAEAGNAIALTITPDAGKQLKAGSLKYNDGSDHVITGTTFTMPTANVTVTAEFEDIPPTTYTVTVGTLARGSITASPTVAEAGDTIALTITPDAGKQLKAGSLKYNDGTQDIAITGTSFTMPAANVTVTAEFEDIPPTTYTVTVGTLAGGSITASPTVAEAENTITLTITPNAGKQFKTGSLKYNDGTQDISITGTSFTMPAANVTVTAEFEDIPPTTYTVTVGTLAGGSITASPTVAEAGDTIALTITPDAGKQLKAGSLKYNDGTQDISITGTSFTMPAANVTVTAEFETIPPTTYIVTVGTLAGGSITASPTVAEAGNTIALIITPDAGKQLKTGSLKYNDSTQDIAITGTSFVMPAANVTVMAEFEDIPASTYTVTVGTFVGGSITVSPVIAGAGDTITLTIMPDAGKQLKAGSLKYNDGTTEAAITGTSFTMPAANITVTAEFEDIPASTYTVTVGTFVGGSITASPVIAQAGDTIILAITPDAGKQLRSGSLKYSDSTQDIAITGTDFTMPAANVTVIAEFEDIPANSYMVTIGTVIGGRITATPVSAVSGSSISLTIIPDTGKQLKAGSLKYNDGTQEVAITGTSFVLPEANVLITAEFENIPESSTDSLLISIVTPTTITGLMNGTAKSASALGLPVTVPIITSGGSKNVSVIWDVASCIYNQYSSSAQTFTVTGVLILPSGVVNTNNISLSVTISISVNQATNSGSDGSNSGGGGIIGNNTASNPDIKLPSIAGSEAKGWDAIVEYVSDNNMGSIIVDMNGATTVTQGILEVIKGKDIDLTLDLGNGIQWIIHGTDIPESTDYSQLHDIDLNLSMNTDSIPAELLNTLSETDRVQISLTYDGNFGFTATLRLPVEKKYGGKIANLFYYNPVTNQIELQAVGIVDKNGNIEFPFTHASDYVIVMSNTAMLETAMDTITVTPVKKTLYIGGTKGSSVTIKTIIPDVVQKAVFDGVCDMTKTYKSSNPKVATVSDSGKIIAKKAGTITITTTITINGMEKSLQTIIKVKRAYIRFTKGTKTMKLGKTYTFLATGYGVESDDITFTTSVKSVVTINRVTGKAMAKSAGIDYVIVKAGNVEVKTKVVVQE